MATPISAPPISRTKKPPSPTSRLGYGRMVRFARIAARRAGSRGLRQDHRPGLHKCYDCMKPFTVRVGTVFEFSHVALHLWLQAVHLMCSSKKGISSNQLHRTLGVTLKTAWFMSHRIREAMTTLGVEPMGGEGGIVEIDETYIGTKEGAPVRRGYGHKNAVMTLISGVRPAQSGAPSTSRGMPPLICCRSSGRT